MNELLLRNVEVDGALVDVRVVESTIAEVGERLAAAGSSAEVVDGHGGALIPGLHDHHIHLMAAAAARRSIRVGPNAVRDLAGLERALRRADAELAPGRWLRAVGYHESVAGDLDRHALDRLVPSRAVRVQHRSGARWVLNSAAITTLGLDRIDRAELERDPAGTLTGRIHRADDWLRGLLPREEPPDLRALGAQLAGYGVTGVTDATPYSRLVDMEPIVAAAVSGDLRQRVVATGGPALAGAGFPAPLEQGPVKIVIDDAAYPSLDALCCNIAEAHRHGRGVAIHCVTRTSLILALAAWEEVGGRAGDRIEHGSVIAPELHATIGDQRLTVVTQPGFVAERGDEYLRDVDPDDRPHLYPCRSLLDAGIPVGGSTDAPYSDPDPWRAITAATNRTTAGGATVAAHEAIPARRALELFLTEPQDPGGRPRRVEPRAAADLCLLAVPLVDALDEPVSERVRLCVRAGTIIAAAG